jgi:CBS domain-containing protein
VVSVIRSELQQAGLETDPDFESAYIDSPIKIQLTKVADRPPSDHHPASVDAANNMDTAQAIGLSLSGAYADPTFRISKLKAANREPIFISPDGTIQQAVTELMANDFSQLPVMTSARDVKGMITWGSIGTRLSVGKSGKYVRDFMDAHNEIRAEASLFQAIPTIVQHQYVLVRGNDNRITGIVTASDLSLQFQQLAEPFLLLGEIENHIRRILGECFSPDELASFQDTRTGKRAISSVADLGFGEYIRILENDDRWQRLKLSIDRTVFCTQLDKIRTIRNDVMHFDPDGIVEADLDRLRDFAYFLQRLQTMGVT